MELFDVYPIQNIELVKAEGCYVYAASGKKYLDLYGGHAVISIGHSHPHYVKRIKDQLDKIAYYSNSVINGPQNELAEKLGNLSGYDDYQLFLCNTGAEANENALKLASFHNGKSKIISFNKSFHGRTSRAVSVTDSPKYRSAVNQYKDVIFVELNDLQAVTSELEKGDICAVIIEGIQGLGGINIPDADFLNKLSKACKKNGALLILDEVQSGYGRTGKFFAHQYSGIKPDIITTAKGMGNGFPIGGVLIHPDIKPWYGMLGTTFGGNHLACAAALAVLEIMEKEELMANAAETGEYLMKAIQQLPEVKEVRGIGLMIGIEFDFTIKDLRKNLLDNYDILTGVASNPNMIRLLPSLTMGKHEADLFLKALKESLAVVIQNNELHVNK